MKYEITAALILGAILIAGSLWLAWGSAALPLALGAYDGPQYHKGAE